MFKRDIILSTKNPVWETDKFANSLLSGFNSILELDNYVVDKKTVWTQRIHRCLWWFKYGVVRLFFGLCNDVIINEQCTETRHIHKTTSSNVVDEICTAPSNWTFVNKMTPLQKQQKYVYYKFCSTWMVFIKPFLNSFYSLLSD